MLLSFHYFVLVTFYRFWSFPAFPVPSFVITSKCRLPECKNDTFHSFSGAVQDNNAGDIQRAPEFPGAYRGVHGVHKSGGAGSGL